MEINKDIFDWVVGIGYTNIKKNKKTNELEYQRMTQTYKPKSRIQWTSNYGEELVKKLLIGLNYNVYSEKPKIKINNKIFSPDIETDDAYYEVKTRNWTTTGTAGEKILGTPMKYSEIPRITNKKLYIVLVGFQEYEADKNFNIFNTGGKNKQIMINLFKNLNIEYIRCSDLLYKYLHKKNLDSLSIKT